MRIDTKVTRAAALVLAAAACLGGLVPWAAAQTTAQKAPPAPSAAPTAVPQLPRKDVAVVVTLRYENGKPVGIQMPNPDPVVLSKGNGHRAHWYLFCQENASIKVEMKSADPEPFDRQPMNSGKESYSGPPTRGKLTGYPYKITVRVDGIEKPFVLDPIIKITP